MGRFSMEELKDTDQAPPRTAINIVTDGYLDGNKTDRACRREADAVRNPEEGDREQQSGDIFATMMLVEMRHLRSIRVRNDAETRRTRSSQDIFEGIGTSCPDSSSWKKPLIEYKVLNTTRLLLDIEKITDIQKQDSSKQT
jgi:hypothetical protein